MKKLNKNACLRASVSKLLLAGSVACATALPGLAQAGPTIEFGEEGYLTFSYALQMWMENSSHRSSNNSGSGFDASLRRNRLTFMGQYNDQLGFYAQLEGGVDSKYGNDDKSVFFRDAYLTYDHSDAVRVILGRFKNTFSRENLEACLEPLTLDRSAASYSPFAGTRDTGAVLWGNLLDAKMQYRLMISDGREGDHNPKDNPRMTVRAHYSFLDPEADYGYRGTYLGTSTVLTVGAGYDYQPDAAYADWVNKQDKKDYKGKTVDVFYEQPTSSGTYTVSAAYFKYDTGDAINSSPDPMLPTNTELKAHYIKAGYLFPDKIGYGRLQVFGRYDRAKYNLLSGYQDQKIAAGGLNYYIDGQRIKLTLEHARKKFDKQHPTDHLQQDHNVTTLGVQVIF